MRANKQNGKMFYGWMISFAGFLLIGISGGLQTNCNVALLEPMSKALGFSISKIALNTSFVSLAAIPCYIVIPKLLKKISIRLFALISGIGFVVFKILFACSSELWQFYICSFMIGICIPGISYISVNSLINCWFNEKKGKAIGIAAAGAGVAGALFLPLITWVIKDFGWRNGCLLQAAISIIMLTMAVIIIKDKPKTVGLQIKESEKEERSTSSEEGYTLKQAMKMPAYYLMMVGVFLLCVVGLGIQTYLMSFMSETGYDTVFSSGILSIVLIVATIGKILLGMVYDKFGTKQVGYITGGLMSVSLILLCVINNNIIVYMFAIVFGFAYATLTVTIPNIISELFGLKEFTAIYGVVLIVASAGITIGAIITGLIYDYLGSYIMAWVLYIFLSVVMAMTLQISYSMMKRKDI